MLVNSVAEIGVLLLRARSRAGKTKVQIASVLGIVANTLCNWENGDVLPPIARYSQIAAAYDLDPQVLYARLLRAKEECKKINSIRNPLTKKLQKEIDVDGFSGEILSSKMGRRVNKSWRRDE